jgi:hypothetical protein
MWRNAASRKSYKAKDIGLPTKKLQGKWQERAEKSTDQLSFLGQG